MSQTLAALAVAHDAGIVHRDLKPENIMLVMRPGDDGAPVETVKVEDFGIAKLVEGCADGEPGQKLTTQGIVAGTPEYISPEQAQAKPLDGRSDLYSCGVILYQMVTGRLPFEAETAIGAVLKHITEEPEPPSKLNPACDPRLEAVIARAMRKNRDERYATAREMRAALRALVEGRTPVAEPSAAAAPPATNAPAPTPTSPSTMTRQVDAPPAPRLRRPASAAILAAAAIAGAVGVLVVMRRPETPPPARGADVARVAASASSTPTTDGPAPSETPTATSPAATPPEERDASEFASPPTAHPAARTARAPGATRAHAAPPAEQPEAATNAAPPAMPAPEPHEPPAEPPAAVNVAVNVAPDATASVA
jgi:serine/threonine-protein kinase